MATTSSNLVAGKALAAGKATTGRGGNSKGSNKGRAAAVVATAALGLSLMVGGLLGHGQQTQQAAQPSVAPFASDTHVVTMWDFREDRRAETRDRFIVDQFTYREDRRVEASDLFAPDQFTYREDRRVESASAAVAADPFLYREDRRVGTSVEFAPDQFTYREDRRVENIAPAWAPDFWTYREDRRDH